MAPLRFLRIEFIDGTSVSYSFPAPSTNKAVKQIRLESFFKDRYVIVHGEGKLTVYPIESVKSLQLSSGEGDLEGIRMPSHVIMGAQRNDS